MKLFSLLNEFNFLKAFFKTSVPFISSDPIFSRLTKGLSLGKETCKELIQVQKIL